MSMPAEFSALPAPFEHHDSAMAALTQIALTDMIWLRNATLATEYETPRPFTGEQERQVVYGRLAHAAGYMGTLGLHDDAMHEDIAAIYEQLDVQVGVARTARSLFERVDASTTDGSQLVALGRAMRNRQEVLEPLETHSQLIHGDNLEPASPSVIATIDAYFRAHPRQRQNYNASVSETNGFSVGDMLVRARPLVWNTLYDFAPPRPELRVALEALDTSRPARRLQRLMDAVTYAYLSISQVANG